MFIPIEAFAGGVNLAAWPDAVPEGQMCAALNVTSEGALGQGVASRLGSRDTTAVVGSGAQAYIIGTGLGYVMVQQGAHLYAVNAGTLAATSVGTFSTSDVAAAIGFGSNYVVICHLRDGVFTWDGTTLTNRSTTAKGNAIASWQNICWVTSDTGNNNRVYMSAIGDPTTWTPGAGAGYVDIKDLDNAGTVCFAVTQGMDIQGRPGLIVAKTTSLYRINTASTGAYTTLSPSVGATSGSSMCSIGDFVYVHAGGASAPHPGIWRTDGIGAPVRVSDAIQPLFDRGTVTRGWVCALRNRLYCEVPDPSGSGGFVGEYDPAGNAWFLHRFAKMPVAPIVPAGYSGMLASYASSSGRLGVFLDNGAISSYATGQDGNDDGDATHVAITASLQTRWAGALRYYHRHWFELGDRFKPVRAWVRGRGASISIGVRRDYSTTQVLDRTLVLPFSGSTVQDTNVVLPLGSVGPARSISFDVQAVTSTLGTRQGLDNQAGTINVGAWGLERIMTYYVNTGN